MTDILCKDYYDESLECINCMWKGVHNASRLLKCKNYDYTEEFDDWD